MGIPGIPAGLVAALLSLGIWGCGATIGGDDPLPNDTAPTHALSGPANWTYLGFAGGQYPGGQSMPLAHRTAGLAAAAGVIPRDANGNAATLGRIVLLSIGMSNTTQEFCNRQQGICTPGTFVDQALTDPAVQHNTLVMVDGARGGQTASTWDEPADPNYDQLRDTRLLPVGLTEKQVQVVWLKVANANPTVSLPASGADAYVLLGQLGAIARTLKTRYPNLKLVFVSNRTFAGYANTTLNPEPFAYEAGFAVKWVVQAQIEQLAGAAADSRAGDLDYRTVAPWLGWGPDLWANGTTPRADGLAWERSDFGSDGTHPSATGVQKVGRLLLEFFKQSPQSRCWFLVSGTCS